MIEHDREKGGSKAQKARDEAGLSQDLFAPEQHSKPLQPNRRPVPGAQSKFLPTSDAIGEAIREYQGVEEAAKAREALAGEG